LSDNVLTNTLDLPPGYYIRYGGAFENLQRATRRLRLVVPIALGMIFLLVFLALRSFKQTVMIYMAIPLSAIGGVFSLWIRDMPFSISAGIGFIVLFGIAVLNGLVLINGWNELKQEASLSLQDRIVQGAKRRIRPILLTASTDILGFMPMAISTSSGAEVQRPMATVVIGGMITATLLTLFLLPVLYRWIESKNPVSTKPVTALFILIFGIFSGPTIMAQNEIRGEVPIGMEEAIGRALSGYPSIKAAGLEVEKQQKLKKTAWDFGQSGLYNAGEELGTEGQGVSTIVGFQHQNLDIFSGFAKSRAQQSKIRYASTREELTSRQLTREVKMAYGKAYIALRQMILFGQIDSLYRSFEEAVKLKLEVDESSRLEFLAAANQARQVAVQKQQADYDYDIALRNLNRWLVSDTLFTVDTIQNLWLQPLSIRGSSINGHPQLQLARDGLLVSQQNISRQKAGYLPKINFQYGIQAIDGTRGFYQYQAGMLFPLIFNKQQGMVQAARVQQDIAAQQLKQTTIELENNLSVSRANYEKWLNSWQFYKQEALPLAEEQLQGSKLAFKEGAIDYVTFLMNTHNALKTQLEALEALDAFLKSKFNLEYLINN